jgi:exopolyphosphatase/guanosine-5'-triphosphate,3'-diphosphate pyrophosphatase
VHGYRLPLSTLKLLLARLASMDLAERRQLRGLHPDRAPTVVAGVAILIRVLEAFELDAFEASEHDILRGVALRSAGVG